MKKRIAEFKDAKGQFVKRYDKLVDKDGIQYMVSEHHDRYLVLGSLIVKVDFVPDADYDEVKASINVSSKLAPAAPVTTKIMTGRDLNTGMIAASELKSGVKGQTYIDEQGDVRTDTGEKVEDIEKKSKIIDLQEKRG